MFKKPKQNQFVAVPILEYERLERALTYQERQIEQLTATNLELHAKIKAQRVQQFKKFIISIIERI